jgi:hypothetical protein
MLAISLVLKAWYSPFEVHDETPDGGRQLFAPGLLRRGGTLHAVSSKALDLAAQGALGRSLALRRLPGCFG